MLNWALIKHPANWFTVTLMTIIGFILLNLILTPWHIPTKGSVGLDANSAPSPNLAMFQ